MKKSSFKLMPLMLTILMVVFCANMFAETVTYSDSWGEQGFTLSRQTRNEVTILHSIQSFSMEDMDIDGETMKTVNLPGHFLPSDEGMPNLPGQGRFVAIPQGSTPSVRIVSSRIETFRNIEVAPSPRIPLETERGPLEYTKNEKAYSNNAFYPAEPVLVSEVRQLRGVEAVMVGITPFQYNPVTKELIVYRDLEVEVTFDGGIGIMTDERLRNQWWEPILRDHVINYESLPEFKDNFRPTTSREEGADYLIITRDNADFIYWANQLKEFRQLQGIRTKVVTVTEIGGNNVNTIQAYINDAYYNWDVPPTAILIMGDHGQGTSGIVSPIYNNYCVSDNIYADIDGDQLPEITMARMTANNAAQIELMVTKIIDYETNPPTNPGYYDNPVTAMGWQTERWFQLCSEIINGFWEHALGKNPVRENNIYSGSPGGAWSTNQNTGMIVDYFGPNGTGYIPATSAHLTDWGANATRINNDINSGAFMIQHRDHGYESGWGEPDYSITNLSGLNNEDLTYVFSINCLTGKYNITNDSFAEAFHKHQQGALGIIAASEISYSFVNDAFVWGMYDNMWPDFMPTFGTTPEHQGFIYPAFGNSAGKIFLHGSNWPYNTNNKEVTYHLFHTHGGAFSTVYSEMPQNLTVNHDGALLSGVTAFEVTADAGAVIALTVDGEIIGREISNGAPVSIDIEPQIPGNTMEIVITKQNYYRYSTSVDIIPPSGPYVVRNDITINDAAGNNNGMVDYNESILLGLSVKNVGVEQAENVTVTISTEDDYITITDNEEFYGNINANQIVNIDDAFAFDVAEDVPNGHVATFLVSATDGTNVWETGFGIEILSPVLVFEGFSFEETIGNNNGKFDAGETIIIETTIKNTGSSMAYDVEGWLNSTSQYITVINTEDLFGDIAADETAVAYFEVSSSNATPSGHYADFLCQFEADNGTNGSGEFNIVVGQIPVAIVDLDENNNSANHMQSALEDIGVPSELLTSFPADLNLYSSIFVCLGIYSNNHVLSSSEGANLADYLNQGGMLYMEGGDTWHYDSQTAVHPMFNIGTTGDGSGDLGTINGVAGTITDGMTFTYNGDNNWIDRLTATGTGQVILNNNSPAYGTGVINDAGSYRTIGASHEFGGLSDGANTKAELMFQYMQFFGLVNNDNPQIAVNPEAFEMEMFPNQTATQALTISNTGTQNLDYEISIEETDIIAVVRKENVTRNNAQKARSLDLRTEWLSANNTSGTILPGQTVEVEVTFNTANMTEGDYSTTINIASNDPFNSLVSVPVDLTILSAPLAEVTIGSATVNAGENFTIPVTTTELTLADNIIAYQFDLSFDEDVVSYIDHSVNGTMSEGGIIAINTANPGIISVGFMTASPISGEGTLIELNFQAVANGETVLDGEDFLYNTDMIPIIDGTVTVGQGGIMYGDLDGNGLVQAFDASMALQFAVGLNTPTPQQIIIADVDGNGVLQAFDASLILQYAVGLINVFPVEEMRDFSAPTAEVKVSVEDNELVFVSNGELYGFEVEVNGMNIFEAKSEMMLAQNDNKVALASAYAIKGEFLRIPFNGNEDAVLNMVVNTQEVVTNLENAPKFNSFNGIYPNPFNPTTSLNFTLKEAAPVSIDIYNVKGAKVHSINNDLPAGESTIKWNADRQASGVYFFKVDINGKIYNRKALLLK